MVALAATYYETSGVDEDETEDVVYSKVLLEEGESVPEALMITWEATIGTDSW